QLVSIVPLTSADFAVLVGVVTNEEVLQYKLDYVKRFLKALFTLRVVLHQRNDSQTRRLRYKDRAFLRRLFLPQQSHTYLIPLTFPNLC
ncbi:MAG: hypothetical protein ACE5IW_13085, partial [bacterium]